MWAEEEGIAVDNDGVVAAWRSSQAYQEFLDCVQTRNRELRAEGYEVFSWEKQ